jgi:hypothetical protein
MTPEQVKETYRRMLNQTITVRRYTGTGTSRPKYEAEVLARVTGFEPHDLVGLALQGDRRVILLADDLAATQFPTPLLKGDKVVVRGRELNIEAPDDSTRRVGDVLIAYELRVRG